MFAGYLEFFGSVLVLENGKVHGWHSVVSLWHSAYCFCLELHYFTGSGIYAVLVSFTFLMVIVIVCSIIYI